MADAFLRVMSGPRRGSSVPLREDRPLLIGRVRGDLLLEDALVSGAHCRIVHRQGRYVIQDLGSTNGTLVDGRRVQDHVLRPGSEISVGNTRLMVFGQEEQARTPTGEDSTDRGAAWLLEAEVRSADDDADLPEIGQGLQLPKGFRGSITVIAGPDQGQRYPMGQGTLTIGRKQGEIPLADVEISRRHAYLEVFGRDVVFLRDADSTNGTYHNGVRARFARVVPGDTIGCGKSMLRFEVR